eukprot:scaffold5043_cov115-Isochrysis_galbana.AAC.6
MGNQHPPWPSRPHRSDTKKGVAVAAEAEGRPSEDSQYSGPEAVVVHAALNPSPRKRRPEEGEGMGEEWERGGGVKGRHWTEVSRRVAASV